MESEGEISEGADKGISNVSSDYLIELLFIVYQKSTFSGHCIP